MTDHPPPEPEFYFDRELDGIVVRKVAGGDAALFTARSPAKETANEDALLLLPVEPGTAILAVADGVGGLPGGEMAASLALQELARTVEGADREGDWLRASIVSGIEAANRAVLELGSGGTTLAVAELSGSRVRPYHVGDSVILLTGQRGRVRMQTVPHSPLGYAIESGLLDEWSAMVHEDRHLIDNMIGSAEMRIEIGPSIELARHDTLLVASDGLTDNLHTDEIVDRIRKGPVAEAAEALRQECRARMIKREEKRPGKPDDLSFVVWRSDGAGS